nr:hypothetical protein [Acidobacteriota bacterium]
RPARVAGALPPSPLPVITMSEAALVRARALHSRGRLQDAARALTSIPSDDPLRRDADALLAGIQDALLAAHAR